MNTFETRATLLGLSPTTSFIGQVTISSVEQLESVLSISGSTPSHADLMGGVPHDPDDPGHAVLRQVLNSDEVTDADRVLAAAVFPMQLNVASLTDKTISSEWNLNSLASSGPILVSIGTLTIEDGGYITVSNRTLDMTVDMIVRNGVAPPPQPFGIFNILGQNGTTGLMGNTPAAPGQAASGHPGNCNSAGIAGDAGGDGTPGSTGSMGLQGGQGGAAAPSLPATIRISTAVQTTVPLTIVTQSGAGGKGGTGGTGSAGGQGGNGGNGATCGCTGSAGGSAAQGGQGGTGGQGGLGSNAVDAQGNIVVQAPAAYTGMFMAIKRVAGPGAGGDPGAGGPGGAGGRAGTGGKHNDGGSGAGSGPTGNPGLMGPAGSISGQPGEILIQPIAV